jgi:hypothetical protein
MRLAMPCLSLPPIRLILVRDIVVLPSKTKPQSVRHKNIFPPLMSFPVAYASSGKLMPAYHGSHPNTHQVNVRLKKQWFLIMRAYKDGKITKSQAASLRADLKAVHKQEAAFFKVNKSYELTADQQSQLNKTLDTYSTTIGETTSNN